MKLKDQVCSVEQSKKLKALGILAYSLFSHVELPETKYRLAAQIIVTSETLAHYTDKGDILTAFTVSELSAMLPEGFVSWRDEDGIWHCSDSQGNRFHMSGGTQAEAIAAELISQLEVGFVVTASEVHKRLLES